MSVPKSFKALIVKELTHDFRRAVEIRTLPMPKPGPGELLVKNIYAGVNAVDINMTAGRFLKEYVPYFVGHESVSVVKEVGDDVNEIKVGQFVGTLDTKSAYAEYSIIKECYAFLLPDARPQYVSLLISGLTAAIGLDKVGDIKKGDTVLITAAAGGLGQIADLGCETVINYKTENVSEILRSKHSTGINVVWETMGGEMFDQLYQHVAVKGKLLVIGAISTYKVDGPAFLPMKVDGLLPIKLLRQAASVRGFMVPQYQEFHREYFYKLMRDYHDEKIVLNMNDGRDAETGGKFEGLDGVIRGVEYLISGRSHGKVFVTI